MQAGAQVTTPSETVGPSPPPFHTGKKKKRRQEWYAEFQHTRDSRAIDLFDVEIAKPGPAQ